MKSLIRFTQQALPLFLTSLFVFLTCNEEPTKPPIVPPTTPDSLRVELTIEDFGAKDVCLRVTLPDSADGRTVWVNRNGKTLVVIGVQNRDSLLTDTTVSPATTYRYEAFRLNHQGDTLAIATTSVTTLGLTSHAFKYVIDTLGVMNSWLLDVAIADDGTIWAVGQVKIRDSTGKIEDVAHNVVKWNGKEWEYLKMYFKPECGRPDSSAGEAKSIFISNDRRIWIGGAPAVLYQYQPDGMFNSLCIPQQIRHGTIQKIYVKNNRSLYAAGTSGTIYYWDGNWSRQQTETDLGLTDIADTKAGLFACGISHNINKTAGVVLKQDGIYWKKVIEGFFEGSGFRESELFKTQLYGNIESIWQDERGTLYACGNMLYQFKNGKWGFVRAFQDRLYDDQTRGYLHSIRGTASNDIFVFGERNTIRHFNGATWQQVEPPFDHNSPILWYHSDIRNNVIVGVGTTIQQKAVIVRLWR